MIIGLGSDLCDIRRIEASLAKFGERFTARIFSEVERARSDRRAHSRAASYAKRFAAKEACAKALGTGFRRGRIFRGFAGGEFAERAADDEFAWRGAGAAEAIGAGRV